LFKTRYAVTAPGACPLAVLAAVLSQAPIFTKVQEREKAIKL
jgi:hypothetical protein